MRIVFGDHAVGLHGRSGVARIVRGHRNCVCGRGKSGIGIAVGEQALAHQIAADRLVKKGRIVGERRFRIDHRRTLAVLDLDQVEGILGDVAVGRDGESHRLSDVAHAINCHGARLHRSANAGDQGVDDGQKVGSRDDGHDAGKGRRRRDVDRENIRMTVRRAQKGGVQGICPEGQIVHIASAPGKEGGILDAFHGLAEPASPVQVHGAPPFEPSQPDLEGDTMSRPVRSGCRHRRTTPASMSNRSSMQPSVWSIMSSSEAGRE